MQEEELDSCRAAGERGLVRDVGAGRNQSGFSLQFLYSKKDGRRTAAPLCIVC